MIDDAKLVSVSETNHDKNQWITLILSTNQKKISFSVTYQLRKFMNYQMGQYHGGFLRICQWIRFPYEGISRDYVMT